jgi:SAM-dependent methyltransferase
VGTPAGHDHWFEPIAEHLGSAYLRYSFTKGTVQEIDFLVAALGLAPGTRVLDVGCGPGRHAHELARRGMVVHGVDISERFVDLARRDAPPGATFERLDARALSVEGRFDVAMSLCQGAFGLLTGAGEDERVLAGMARSLVPGGRLVLSAFNAYFAVRHHTEAEFDADTGIDHEWTEVRDEAGTAKRVELWTSCFTPRELRLLVRGAGCVVDAVHSVEPGAYAALPPTTESPEFLVLATRPAAGAGRLTPAAGGC